MYPQGSLLLCAPHLNLQFSSSAELIPMQYTPLQNGGGETETPGAGWGSETPDASGENTGN